MQRSITIRSLSIIAAFVAGASFACQSDVILNSGHCFNAAGDQTCAEHFGSERPYCVGPGEGCDGEPNNNGCVAEPPLQECYSPCGNSTLAAEDSSCLGTAEETEESGEEGDGDGDGDGDLPCMGPEDCTDPSAPICDPGSGQCSSCDATADPDSACAGLDGATPLCVAGACVACTEADQSACTTAGLICDTTTNACVGCTSHDQCSPGACNLAEGRCISASKKLHVNAHGLNCAGADGSLVNPYCDIESALVAAGDEAILIIHPLAEDDWYYGYYTITKTVVMLGYNGERPRLRSGNAAVPALTVAPSGELFIDQLELWFSPVGIEVNGGSCWVDRSMIAWNNYGVLVNGGDATIRRSRVTNHLDRSIVVDDGGILALENAFVGGHQSNQAAVEVLDGAATIIYSTIVGVSSGAIALSCPDGASVSVRNSLVIAFADSAEIICDGVTVTDSALEMFVAGNTMLSEPADTSWFGDYSSGDFSLSGAHPEEINNAAIWRSGDPPTGVDLTLNTTVDFRERDLETRPTPGACGDESPSGAEPAIMGLQLTHNGGCPMKIIIELPEECNALAEVIQSVATRMKQEVRKAKNLSRPIDFRTVEDVSAEHANAFERGMLEGLLRAVAVDAEKIVVDGETYAKAVEGVGEYHSLAGTVKVPRWLYRKTTERNGSTFDPVAARIGALEGGWLRSTAEAIARVLQEMPTRPAQALAESMKRLPYSRTSFEHVGHLVGARVVAALPDVEDGAGRMLLAALDERVKSVSFAVDRVSIPMEESKPRPVGRPKKGAAKRPVDRVFRMAYTGVVTLHDDKGEALHSHRYGRMPSDDVNEMMHGMGEDISALLRARPDLEVAALADGAPEMWTLIELASGIIETDHGHKPHMHVDFWHLVEKLVPAAAAIHGEEAGARVIARWRTRLLNHHGAACQIRQELIDSGRSTGRTGNPVHEAITYLTNHADRFGYAAARTIGLPIGSGAVEATCKTVVSVRMKRSGARWKDETGRHVLLLRVLAQSDAWPVIREIALCHHAPNICRLPEAA